MADEPAEKARMTEREAALAKAAVARHQKRTFGPYVDLEKDGDGWRPTCPFHEADEDAWWVLLLDVFGTRSSAVGGVFLHQLQLLCPEYWSPETGHKPGEAELQTALSIVASIKPQNEAQACLAAQFVALHFGTMKVGQHIAGQSYPDPRTLGSLAAVVKASAGVMETVQKLQGKGGTRQTIKVTKKQEQHVHYHDERHVHLRGGGRAKSGSQSQGRDELRAREASAGEPSQLPDLRRSNASGDIVPFPCGEGAKPVPASRRSRGDRSAEG